MSWRRYITNSSAKTLFSVGCGLATVPNNLRKHNQFNGKPLAVVKETIRQQLRQAQSQTAVQKIQDNLFNKYNFKIEREKLKADEI